MRVSLLGYLRRNYTKKIIFFYTTETQENALFSVAFIFAILVSLPRGTLYQQKLALTSPTSGGRSVGIVRSRTQAMEFFY
jgi:hypothetical protein